jgi:hypothetical protein
VLLQGSFSVFLFLEAGWFNSDLKTVSSFLLLPSTFISSFFEPVLLGFLTKRRANQTLHAMPTALAVLGKASVVGAVVMRELLVRRMFPTLVGNRDGCDSKICGDDSVWPVPFCRSPFAFERLAIGHMILSDCALITELPPLRRPRTAYAVSILPLGDLPEALPR